MSAGGCTMRAFSMLRLAKMHMPSTFRTLSNRELSSSNLSSRQRMEGFTIKDHRPTRPRVAKEKRKQYLAQRKDSFEAEQEKASSLGLGWGIRSALLLERLPVIVEEYTDWQRDFWDLQAQQAQYGIKFPAEMGFKYDDEKPPTMEELLEQSPIALAPRRTPADESNDRTTLDRALDQRLVLIVRPQAGGDWRLPDSSWKTGETIRQAAERTAQRILVKTATWKGQRDDVAQLHFVGNCPAGWFWRTQDTVEEKQSENYGDKVFINRVQLICGQPAIVKSEAAEHLWVTKDEIGIVRSKSHDTWVVRWTVRVFMDWLCSKSHDVLTSRGLGGMGRHHLIATITSQILSYGRVWKAGFPYVSEVSPASKRIRIDLECPGRRYMGYAVSGIRCLRVGHAAEYERGRPYICRSEADLKSVTRHVPGTTFSIARTIATFETETVRGPFGYKNDILGF